jgi:hypothetical protein
MSEKTILRAQWDGRKQMWKIVKKTTNGAGGWARFGTSYEFSKESSEHFIDLLVAKFPQHYEKEP